MSAEPADPKIGPPKLPRLDLPENFLNRELSWIDFNRRVLEEARNIRHPLLERVKFLAISDANLDEFFMVRVSGLMDTYEAGVVTRSPDGRTPFGELNAVREALRKMIAEQQSLMHDSILPSLAAGGVRIAAYERLTAAEKRDLDEYFDREMFPVCTPLAIDPVQAFPFISNLSLNLLVALLDSEGTRHLARLKVPPFARLLTVGRPISAFSDTSVKLVWLEDLLRHHLASFFPGFRIVGAYPFRVLRDADFEIKEIEAGDLLERVRTGLQMRRFGEAVALEVDDQMPVDLRNFLIAHLDLDGDDVYPVHGRLGLADLSQVLELDLDRPELKDQPFVPRVPAPLVASSDIFAAIQQHDILLHHPFDSFDPVIELLNQAAADPNVLAIKQALYRVGQNSPVVDALRRAVDRGKQVAVLIELTARFDEENNIGWAQELERAGVHVMYGFAGIKVHCKVALIVRREPAGIRRYVHIGTGNYNRTTSRLYTDLGLLTCREDIGEDASHLFNSLTGFSNETGYRALLVAPLGLREGLRRRIEREIVQHRANGNGRLLFKMNALTDPELIQLLYEASRAGVTVDLLVRGICCLRPGVPGLSENVRVLSLVGRFLEHSRVYYFRNGGEEEVLIGSADLMQRNLDHRVEVLAPIFDPAIRDQLKGLLEGYLRDTLQTHRLGPDGSYERLTPGSDGHDMQRALLEEIETAPEGLVLRFPTPR